MSDQAIIGPNGKFTTKFESILDTVGNTPLVRLGKISPNQKVSIYAKLEGTNPTGSVKDRIAKYMIDKAEEDGLIKANTTILEATSGNTGISLAMIGCLKGYKVKVIMPENVSEERVQLLKAYGASINFSDGSKGTNGSILVAQDMALKDDSYFMPYQYGNEANPRAHYETTAEEIIRDLPEADIFVAGLGTGGTLMGIGRRLKEHNPNVKIIAVAPNPDDIIQGLRSLEEGFIPPIIDLSVLDSRIMVESKEAFYFTRELMKREGLFAGISSGSVIAAARRIAAKMDTGNIVCLLADGGWKYLSTNLWTTDFGKIEGVVEGKIWW